LVYPSSDLATSFPCDVVCVQVVLHDMLVDPVNRGCTDVVHTETKEAVHPVVAAHGTVVCVMLDVETYIVAVNYMIKIQQACF
jgi:hypothetical protein